MPIAPEDPQTFLIGNMVNVEWSESFDQGSPIKGYKLFIQGHDGEYRHETTECDGNSAEVIANRVCLISLSRLTAAPYSLVLDESIWVKVIATNIYGDSEFSVEGNGALIKLVPDAPISLACDFAATNAFTIALTWFNGLSNGGLDILDYDIYYDEALGGEYTLIGNNIEFLYY